MTCSDASKTLWLALGSNLGDRESNLRAAFQALRKLFLSPPRLSGLWESKARYYESQPDFLNAVVCGETTLSPIETLDFALAVEDECGRLRAGVPTKGPRTLDIDILLYGDEIICSDRLIVPHPGMRERKFVLLPMLEIDPGLVDPVSGKPFVEYLRSLPPQGIYPWNAPCYDAPYP